MGEGESVINIGGLGCWAFEDEGRSIVPYKEPEDAVLRLAEFFEKTFGDY